MNYVMNLFQQRRMKEKRKEKKKKVFHKKGDGQPDQGLTVDGTRATGLAPFL
jgi:hypothetical protein